MLTEVIENSNFKIKFVNYYVWINHLYQQTFYDIGHHILLNVQNLAGAFLDLIHLKNKYLNNIFYSKTI